MDFHIRLQLTELKAFLTSRVTMQYLLILMLPSVNRVISEALTWRFACLSGITICHLHAAEKTLSDTDSSNKSASMFGLDFMASLRVPFPI